MIHVLRSYVVGPLEPFAEGFAAELARQRYTVDTMRQQLGLVAHLSRWMAAGGLMSRSWRRRSSNGMWMHAVPLVTGNFDR